ncbi:MAG: prepilin-type N-terminal cleavage/methylation domain-containing protein [Candidatus Saccharibacteria bacterium]
MNIKQRLISGFTIVEVTVVIFIIGILAAITYISYDGIQKRVIDVSVDSDVQRIASLELNYKTNNGSTALAYYSGGGTDSGLGFTPKTGNLIDVVIKNSDYCVRGYNPAGNKDTIYNSSIKESTSGICSQIAPSPIPIAGYSGPKLWTKVSASYNDTCAVATDNNAYCWGMGNFGQLGNNATVGSTVPVAVSTAGVLSGKTIKSISTGNNNSCVIASDNKAYCWGANWYGGLGNNTTTDSSVPVAVNTSGVLSGKTIKSITVGAYHTCAVASDNLAYCWGHGNSGQLGNNTIVDSLVPVAVNTAGVLSGKTVLSLSAGVQDTCAVASDNLAYCWGSNQYGILGDGTNNLSSVPVAANTSGVLSGKTINSITASYYHSCVIASDNQVYCWGSNWYGELGNNSTADSWVPVATSTTGALSGKTVISIANSTFDTCAIASDFKVYCWGGADYGQLGNSTFTQSNVPVVVSNTSNFTNQSIISISATDSIHACALAFDNNIYCWGSNIYGELGNGSTTNSNIPVQSKPALY